MVWFPLDNSRHIPSPHRGGAGWSPRGGGSGLPTEHDPECTLGGLFWSGEWSSFLSIWLWHKTTGCISFFSWTKWKCNYSMLCPIRKTSSLLFMYNIVLISVLKDSINLVLQQLRCNLLRYNDHKAWCLRVLYPVYIFKYVIADKKFIYI